MKEDIVCMHRFSFALFLIDTGSHAHFFLFFTSHSLHVTQVVRWPAINNHSFHATPSFSTIVHKLEFRHGIENEYNNEYYIFQSVVAQKWQKLSACFSHIYFHLFIRVWRTLWKGIWIGISLFVGASVVSFEVFDSRSFDDVEVVRPSVERLSHDKWNNT